jgi:CubicO group peptidase (beta-lactamase class C family)
MLNIIQDLKTFLEAKNGYIEELLQKNIVPSCSIGVFNSKEIFTITKLAQNNSQVNPDTAYRIASLSKPVFAFFILSLVNKKIIDLDTPLIEYFGEKYIDEPKVEKITARHVLSHQTGFPNWAYNNPLIIQFEPGTQFDYSGEGFMYLQNTIEKLLQKPINELMDEKIYRPLGMKSSATAKQFLTTENKTLGHDKDGIALENENLSVPHPDYARRMKSPSNMAGTMWSSINDFTKFLFHIVCKDTSVLPLMSSPQVDVPDWNTKWGLGAGLQQGLLKEGYALWQWGDDNGFKTFTITELKQKTGITIFTNGNNGFNVYSDILKNVLPELPQFVISKLNEED